MDRKYVKNPEYITLEGRTVDTRDGTIPSGASIVRGIYYKWDDQGFTGNGWLQNVTGGPTNMYPGFNSDDDVASYVLSNGNLNAVFENWAKNYDLTGWDNFYNAVGVDSGCMDVDHGSQE